MNVFNIDVQNFFYKRFFVYFHVLFFLIKRLNFNIIISINEAEKNDDSKIIEKKIIENILFLFSLKRF